MKNFSQEIMKVLMVVLLCAVCGVGYVLGQGVAPLQSDTAQEGQVEADVTDQASTEEEGVTTETEAGADESASTEDYSEDGTAQEDDPVFSVDDADFVVMDSD